MRKKLYTALILLALSVVSFSVAFALYFDPAATAQAFEERGVSPLVKNVFSLVREGMEPTRGCTTADFAGDLRRIEISTISADVRIEALADDAPALDSDTGINCLRRGDRLEIRVPPFSFRKDRRSVDLRMPPTEHDAVTLHLPKGKGYEVTARTISGDIRVEDLAVGKLAVESKSGDISIKGLTGDLTASAVSGDIRADIAELPLFAAAVAVSGDIRLRLPASEPYDITTETVSGEIRMDASEEKGARKQVKIKTVSGDITVDAR